MRKKSRKINEGKKFYTLLINNCKNFVVDGLGKGKLYSRSNEFKKTLKKAKMKITPNGAFEIVNDFIISFPVMTAFKE